MIDNECGVSSRFGYWYTINWIIETNKIGLIEEKGRFNNNIVPFTC